MEIAEERIEGYLNVMNEYGLEVNERKMIAKGNYSHQGGYLAMKELLENVPDLVWRNSAAMTRWQLER